MRLIQVALAVTVLISSVIGGLVYSLSNAKTTQNPPVTITLPQVTKTVTETIIVNNGITTTFSVTTVSTATEISTTTNNFIITSVSYEYSNGQSVQQRLNQSSFVAFIQMQDGAACAYGNTPYLINGTVIGRWDQVLLNQNTSENYFSLSFYDLQLYYQNHTAFEKSYTGTPDFNVTTFSVFENQTVLLDTKWYNLNLNSCLPNSLLMNPT